jgi:hypothetical protein
MVGILLNKMDDKKPLIETNNDTIIVSFLLIKF